MRGDTPHLGQWHGLGDRILAWRKVQSVGRKIFESNSGRKCHCGNFLGKKVCKIFAKCKKNAAQSAGLPRDPPPGSFGPILADGGGSGPVRTPFTETLTSTVYQTLPPKPNTLDN